MASKKHVFTQTEKKMFLDVLKKYSAIVENKNTDGSTLREKNDAWENITREYNASPHATAKVSKKQLRRLWMNLKQRQRAMKKERQYRTAAGGEPLTSDTAIDPDVAQIAPAQMNEIPGAIDSDIFFPVCSLTTDSSQSESSLNISKQPCTPDVTLPSPPTATTPASVPHSSGTTHPHPSTPSSPPLSIRTIPQSSMSTSTTSFSNIILEKEYRDRFIRAGEIHAMEKELLVYKIREAKAKSELAELLLQRVHQQGNNKLEDIVFFLFLGLYTFIL